MSSEIIMGNLPKGTEPSDIVELFRNWGSEVQAEIRDEGDPDRLMAVVTLDVDGDTARSMAERSRGVYYKGRSLSVYAPLLMGRES